MYLYSTENFTFALAQNRSYLNFTLLKLYTMAQHHDSVTTMEGGSDCELVKITYIADLCTPHYE